MPALEKRPEAPYVAWHRLTRLAMKAAQLADRGVVRVAGDDARQFLNGLLTADIGTVTPERARYAALLTPQGKIVVDCIVAQAPAEDGGALFLDCSRAPRAPPHSAGRLRRRRARGRRPRDGRGPGGRRLRLRGGGSRPCDAPARPGGGRARPRASPGCRAG